MVSPNQETLVHGIKLSSVGPGLISGRDAAYELTNMDLAMKLHYLRFIYYFTSQAVPEELTIKHATFVWLTRYYMTCGRFRRAESGRPYIKCNDCGVRFIEAHCEKSVDDWLELKDDCMEQMLVYGQVIGPEMQFSPLVFLQLTTFKCGGASLGLSWAHVLGDAFVAAEFMAELGLLLNGQAQPPTLGLTQPKLEFSPSPPTPSNDPVSLKRVGPVGDHWVSPNNYKMEIFSFHLTSKQINQLHSKVCGEHGIHQISAFDSLCAIIWKSVAKIRNGPEPKLVTICKIDSQKPKSEILCNRQVVSVVEAEFPIMKANLKEIAELVNNRTLDERSRIEAAVERDQGLSDFIFYGANLTFLDLEDVNIYGFQMKGGEKPIYASCTMDGVGKEGLVLLIPGPKSGSKVVTLIMPEIEVLLLKADLEREFAIF